MQSLAAENNLPETAFILPHATQNGHFAIRWFSPTHEVPLCGHATLAAAYAVQLHTPALTNSLTFHAKHAILQAQSDGNQVSLRLPSIAYRSTPIIPELEAALGAPIIELYEADDWFTVVEDEQTVRDMQVNVAALGKPPARDIIVTARGEKVDFVSRCFFPNVGIPEDPVTGSAHCIIAPYWGKKLSKTTLLAHQISARGGKLHCTVEAKHVTLTGQVALHIAGEIAV